MTNITKIDSKKPMKLKPLLETWEEMAFWGSVWTSEVDLVQFSSDRICFKSRAIVQEETK